MIEFGDARLPGRFWSQVELNADGCWIWTGRCNENGYGRYSNRFAHRVAYQALVQELPETLVIDHFRMNPGERSGPCSKRCINPMHLEPVTRVVNALRWQGRFCVGCGEAAREKLGPVSVHPDCWRGAVDLMNFWNATAT